MVRTVVRQTAHERIEPGSCLHIASAVELSEQVGGFAVPEAVVFDKSAELNDGADHPLQHQPEQQVAALCTSMHKMS